MLTAAALDRGPGPHTRAGTASGRRNPGAGRAGDERGYALAVLLVAVSVIGIALTAAVPAWQHRAQREREMELVFRGEQYARAISLYTRRNNGALPPGLDALVEGRFLRKRYADPMVEDGGFVPVAGAGGIAGVTSRSGEPSIRVYHGARRYKDWRFGPKNDTPVSPGQHRIDDRDKLLRTSDARHVVR